MATGTNNNSVYSISRSGGDKRLTICCSGNFENYSGGGQQ